MSYHAPIAAGEPPPAPSRRPRSGNRWTAPKMAAFLRELSATHSVSAAARAVGMSRESAYRLRSRLKGGAFDLGWDVAFQHSYDNLAHAMLERAVNGVEVPVFYRGEKVGSYRRYDDRVGLALLQRCTPRRRVPIMGRHAGEAECHARRFEALLAEIEAGLGEARAIVGGPGDDPGPEPCGEILRLEGVTAQQDDDTEILAMLAEAYDDAGDDDQDHGA